MKQVSLLFCMMCFFALAQTSNATHFPTPLEVSGNDGEGDKGTSALFKAKVVTKEFKDILNIDIRTETEQMINVEIFNSDGESVFNDKLALYGVMLKKIYTDDYPAGNYIVVIRCKNEKVTEDIVKR